MASGVAILGFGLAVVIGLVLGLLGGGGAILAVPALHYVLGYPVKSAIPMSLVVIGLTSGFGVIHHTRAGSVRWRTAAAFGIPAIVGALIGAELGLRVDPAAQLTVFGLVLGAAAISMLRAGFSRQEHHGVPVRMRRRFVALVGAGVGILTGFAGVGGGFLYVPALSLIAGLPMKDAIGTSLMLITLSCGAGLARYAGDVRLDWPAIALFTGLAFVGVAIGSRLIPYFSARQLKRYFAFLLIAMSALVLALGR